ncbi:YdhK family protein [Corynebacterium sp. AOP40-9SA-29]|uniref:YdhK family protein n=1 Tax=Corynebacterium sp. AOP40-9SA-29 TaxID=3457677 RepID=UPI004033F992
MSKRLTALTAATLIGTAMSLTACSPSAEDSQQSSTDTSTTSSAAGHGDHDGMDMDSDMEMDHPADGGPAPEGIAEASDPEFPVGTEVVLTTDHMAGMEGATATVVGAFDTYTYSVSYTPTTGGEPVEDHKWVVQEELADAGSERLEDGATVTLEADHMTGMKGATATIDSSTDETVYMVDYESDGMTMTNHKWVTESEMRAAN